MYNFRELILAVTAIFLALGLGILVGVSLGDNYLVSNQKEVIERLERELGRLKGQVARQDINLERYREIEPLALQQYRNSLPGREILILGREEQKEQVLEVMELVKMNGAAAAAIIFPAEEPVDAAGPGPQGGSMLQPPWLPPELRGNSHLEIHGGLDGPGPDGIVLLLARAAPGSGQSHPAEWAYFLGTGKPVIAVAGWEEGAPPFQPAIEFYSGLVDNINTFWGRLALLEILSTGGSGEYGFDHGRTGLIPARQEGELR